MRFIYEVEIPNGVVESLRHLIACSLVQKPVTNDEITKFLSLHIQNALHQFFRDHLTAEGDVEVRAGRVGD
jgi:hypothetical protein